MLSQITTHAHLMYNKYRSKKAKLSFHSAHKFLKFYLLSVLMCSASPLHASSPPPPHQFKLLYEESLQRVHSPYTLLPLIAFPLHTVLTYFKILLGDFVHVTIKSVTVIFLYHHFNVQILFFWLFSQRPEWRKTKVERRVVVANVGVKCRQSFEIALRSNT